MLFRRINDARSHAPHWKRSKETKKREKTCLCYAGPRNPFCSFFSVSLSFFLFSLKHSRNFVFFFAYSTCVTHHFLQNKRAKFFHFTLKIVWNRTNQTDRSNKKKQRSTKWTARKNGKHNHSHAKHLPVFIFVVEIFIWIINLFAHCVLWCFPEIFEISTRSRSTKPIKNKLLVKKSLCVVGQFQIAK